jgi:hypothetical protein
MESVEACDGGIASRSDITLEPLFFTTSPWSMTHVL